jgi:NAD(P)-dependent dehydrogenase (short-subunit alcohol dehydrogenase family)
MNQKVALVTGASSGIGTAIVLRLVDEHSDLDWRYHFP